MGRWSASHRKLAIFGWLAFVLSAIVVGTALAQKTIDNQNNNVG
jgi:RND superfamily putative drug exporter